MCPSRYLLHKQVGLYNSGKAPSDLLYYVCYQNNYHGNMTLIGQSRTKIPRPVTYPVGLRGYFSCHHRAKNRKGSAVIGSITDYKLEQESQIIVCNHIHNNKHNIYSSSQGYSPHHKPTGQKLGDGNVFRNCVC